MTDLVRQIIAAQVQPPTPAGEGQLQASYCFPADFLGFSGHFPGYPVLPAVIQIRLGQLLAETLGGRPLRLETVAKGKFLQQIRPEQTIEVVCRAAALGGKPAFELRLTVEAKTAAQFWLVPQEGAEA